MPAPAALLALLVAAPIAVPPSASAIRAVPDEPGVFVLPDAAILQTVVADLDGDGRRELVRLVRGDGDAALAEVWVERGSTWAILGEPVEVVPPSRIGLRIDEVYQATPVRLLVRRVDGVERVTVASQPHFEEIDVGEPCCLLLHDLVFEPGGNARRVEVAEPSDFAGSVLVIDLDGDGTDELLSSLLLPPAGDVTFPLAARVHRWTPAGFGDPVVTTMAVGSGDEPFLLGDSDGVPGDEAAVAGTAGPSPGLVRIRLAPGDGLVADPGELAADQALAIPLGDGRGVALSGPDLGLIAAAWPTGERISTPVGSSQLSDARLIGIVEVERELHLALHRPQSATLHLLGVPGLEPQRDTLITRSHAAERLADVPVSPFVGSLPAVDPASPPDVAHAGTLVVGRTAGEVVSQPIATLADAVPIGLVGDGTLMALHHGPVALTPGGPGGGTLTVPSPAPEAWISIAPTRLVREPESETGDLQPAIEGALELDRAAALAVGAAGFSADILAPPGSRVLVSDGTRLTSRVAVVPDGGVLTVQLLRAVTDDTTLRQHVSIVVTTPAGHAYLTAWDVTIRIAPPQVEAAVTTPIGSSALELAGATVPGAVVRVDGHAVEVGSDGRFAARAELPPWPTDLVIEVDDSLGNVSRTTVTGVGWFDYRALPWPPIVAAIVAGAAIFLFLRVPRLTPMPRRADDDSALEELEPD